MTTTRYDLDALELATVRELLIARLATPLGRTAVAEMAPLEDAAAANTAQRQGDQLAQRLAQDDRPPLRKLREVRSWLPAFFAGEHRPTVRDLLDLKHLLGTVHGCRAWLAAVTDAPDLNAMAASFPEVRDLAGELGTVVDESGEIPSTASVKLGEIRREIAVAEVAVRQAVQRFLADETVYQHLQNPQPAWRHGRPVFQVRQESRGKIPGVLHDRSHSGATLFIEPSVVVESANRLSDAHAAEHREIEVILAHICRGLRRYETEILAAVAAVVHLDLTIAKARLITEQGFLAATVADDTTLSLVGARHPLLLLAKGEEVVPLTLTLGDRFTLLVVTGPNTGGKTVVLKTIGLLSVMALCGLPLPTREASTIPFYDGVFVDIGDEQAISQNLSTFSSHITRISRCLSSATERSLVLLDELGAGTDPQEGGALGYAVLQDLERRGVHAVVTTHIGVLKDFAYQHRRAENGSMAFDGKDLEPLFRLELGIPGQSHALDIAGRVGMDPQLVERARQRLDARNQVMAEAIDKVHIARRRAEADRQTSEELVRAAAAKDAAAADRLTEMSRREAWLQEEADAVVEEYLRQSRAILAERLQQLGSAPKPFGEQARKLQEEFAALYRDTSVHRRRMKFLGGVRKNHVVYVPRLGRRCTVRKVDRVREVLTVVVGKMQMEIPFEDVSWLQPLE
ncbi:MAG: endonuclease MutS2 [Planctomycetota bacterium]